MKKSLFALAAVAAFASVQFAGSAVAAPVHLSPSVTQSHEALTTVKAGKKASHKGHSSHKSHKAKKSA